MDKTPESGAAAAPPAPGGDGANAPGAARETPPVELGGPSGPEPTRYGDWERKGRCFDF